MNTTKLLKYTVYFPSIILILGCIYVKVYYDAFDIDIFKFISLQEGLLALMSDSITIIVIILFAPSYFLLFKLPRLLLRKIDSKIFPEVYTKKRFFLTMAISIIVIIFTTVLLAQVLNGITSNSIRIISKTILIVGSLGALSVIIRDLVDLISTRNGIKLDYTFYNAFYFFIIAFVAIVGIAKTKASLAKETRSRTIIEIHTIDSTIIVKDSFKLIGKTEKFIFLHNNYGNSKLYLPVEQVKFINERSKPVKSK